MNVPHITREQARMIAAARAPHLTREQCVEVIKEPRLRGVIAALAVKYGVSEDLIRHVRSLERRGIWLPESNRRPE